MKILITTWLMLAVAGCGSDTSVPGPDRYPLEVRSTGPDKWGVVCYANIRNTAGTSCIQVRNPE